MAAADNKDTIYVDIDDEITAIIDKVQGSAGKVVALVLPKRATTLQSIVNMKLLKRAADENGKNLVLITTEAGLMPLAGAVGLHVAKTPTSKPEIPMGPEDFGDTPESVDETDEILDDDGYTADNAGSRSIGELAGGAATLPLPPAPTDSGIETVELDNAEPAAATAAAAPTARAAAPKRPKLKKDRHLAVPDFDRFRVLLIAGIALLLVLIIGGWWAFAVAPKASIFIKTNASAINTNVDFTLDTSATTLSTSSRTVPAKQVQTQKTLTGNATATGQENNGDKATGSVTFTSACSNGVQTVPAGTGLSAGGKNYVTQRSVTMFTGSGGGGNCKFSGTTNIVAQQAGTAYNTGDNTKFSLAKSSTGDYDASTITTTGSADGGTDDIQTVVSQADIDSAKGKINATGDSTAQEELKDQLSGQGLFGISSTYNAGQPVVTTSAKAGDAASSVTVTEVITYTMLGANKDDIKTLVDNDIKSQIDTSHQGILDEGITQGAFKLKSLTDSGASMNIQTTAEVGPDIDTASIAQQAAGKKSNEIRSDIQNDPDVTDVTVKMSPFWVTKAPSNVKKITVTVAKPQDD